jgi:hypothetical protein
MVRMTDVVSYDGAVIGHLLDSDLHRQALTIAFEASGSRLKPGVGALAILAGQGVDYGFMVRISVEVGEGQFPNEPNDAEFIEEAEYLTELGQQYVADYNLEECQGDLAGALTPPGRAIVHVRLYGIEGPHEPYLAAPPGYPSRLIPVAEHLLLHIWNESSP